MSKCLKVDICINCFTDVGGCKESGWNVSLSGRLFMMVLHQTESSIVYMESQAGNGMPTSNIVDLSRNIHLICDIPHLIKLLGEQKFYIDKIVHYIIYRMQN